MIDGERVLRRFEERRAILTGELEGASRRQGRVVIRAARGEIDFALRFIREEIDKAAEADLLTRTLEAECDEREAKR